ncbi:hypothetical protein EJK55_1441 [Moraxella catarrhalis]|uniref:Uncharacterized protein n=1 Tax=Moraxella catarrhalis TaxID=480 RepID=A0ABY0BIP0_MORCA|nr:hypothetical protein E9O_03384 [Moraxella catarrhalis 12P80B1]EGE24846.1 hypothetical protein E9Y_04376 [Moraxella catarrhalis 101P30B1]RUO13112.1 hypothetical protein EJK55_1441 [Moraxella catarrhalis]RUO15494.1 hypothetical protein EJK54_1320 [Moraxella catarrhalis]
MPLFLSQKLLNIGLMTMPQAIKIPPINAFISCVCQLFLHYCTD